MVEEGRIMVLLSIDTFKRLEEYAKNNNITSFNDAVKKLLER